MLHFLMCQFLIVKHSGEVLSFTDLTHGTASLLYHVTQRVMQHTNISRNVL